MHEMSIAIALLGPVEQTAETHGLLRVDRIVVRAGALRGVVPEALEMAFASLTEGTVAEAAEVCLDVEPALVRCRRCEHEFEPDVDSYLCPQCGQADVEILAGNDVVLASVEGQQEARPE